MALSKTNVILSTQNGLVPYIAYHLKHPIIIYLDDIIHQDSFLLKNSSISINKYCSTDQPIALTVKNSTIKKGIYTLKTFKGNFKLLYDIYVKVIDSLKPAYSFDFNTGKLFIENKEFIEPKDFDEFLKYQENKSFICGTQFVNNLVDSGKFLDRDSKQNLYVESLSNTTFEYEKYLLSIKEINAFIFLAEKSYKALLC